MRLSTLPDLRRAWPVELDRPRRLRYNLGALALLDEQHNINLIDLEESGLAQAFSHPASLAKIIWVGCLHEDPHVTLEQIHDVIGLSDLGDIVEAVHQAMKLSQRSRLAPPDPEQPNPFPVAAMAGATSSAAGTAPCGSDPGNSTP